MSEKLLKAILKLFAIVAKEDGVKEEERANVNEFLHENLNTDAVSFYMELFDQYCYDVPEGISDHLPNLDFETADFIDDWSKVMESARFINTELTRQQKLVVVLKMIELILADGDMTERETNLVYYIAKSIKVDQKEITLIKDFVTCLQAEELDSEHFLVIDDAEQAPEGSAIRHYRIENFDPQLIILHITSTDTYFIKNLSDQLLYLNGVPMVPNRGAIFSTGSTIRGNRIQPIYYSDVISRFRNQEEGSQISFEASNINYQFPNGHIGLRDINIFERSGKLVGIMGSSGSGKSTLLNILNGNDSPSSGKVRINDIDIHENRDNIEGVIGYVPQDDLLIEQLTVYQNLYFAAKLCFDRLDKASLDKLVNNTLKSLGLSETADLKVGSPLEKTISGGQRKRLNIGLELLREPSVLFVDEPTSGLSSRDSENIMDLLKELSLKGKLIFVVIHQPSSDIFKMFDKLIILDVGGYQIYYDNPVEAEAYFKNIVNMIDRDSGLCGTCGNIRPEEVFNIIETRVVNEYGRFTDQRKIGPREWNEHFYYRTELPEVEHARTRPRATLDIPGRLRQISIFARRDILTKLSNKQYMFINLLEAPVLAIILAYIVRFYPDQEGGYEFAKNINIPVFFFMSVIVALFMGLTVSAEEIIKDRMIRKREKFLHLSNMSYLLSKVGIMFCFSAVQTFCFVLVGDYLLEIDGMHITYWLILFSVSCFANMLGLNISSAFNSVITIYILIPLLIIPQLVLSGVVVRFDSLNPHISSVRHVPLLGDVMASRWAFEAVMVNQFRDNKYQRQFYEQDQTMANADYKKLYWLPETRGALDNALRYLNNKNEGQKEEAAAELRLLRNELGKELDYWGHDQLPEYSKLNVNDFDQSVHDASQAFLDLIEQAYINRYNKASEAKNADIMALTATEEGQKTFFAQREAYFNEAIEMLVRNTTEANRIVRIDDELVRKITPIYMIPDHRDNPIDFRAQFFTPVKPFLGLHWNTVYFNIAIIWAMSLLLMVMLYFEVFRRVIHFLSNLPEMIRPGRS